MPAAPISVAVSYPIEQEVTDYAEFTARIAAVDSVEVRARSWGYLEKVNFKEGRWSRRATSSSNSTRGPTRRC